MRTGFGKAIQVRYLDQDIAKGPGNNSQAPLLIQKLAEDGDVLALSFGSVFAAYPGLVGFMG